MRGDIFLKKYSSKSLEEPAKCRTFAPFFSWLERQIVVLNVVGSSPICHPRIIELGRTD